MAARAATTRPETNVQKGNILRKFATQFGSDESGQDLVEYALLLAIIAVAGVATLGVLATSLSTVWTNVNAQLSVS